MVAVGTPVDETLKDKLVTGTGAARRIFSTGRKYRDINEKEKIIESGRVYVKKILECFFKPNA